MGDSNTYGLYVERNETYPSALQELWAADTLEAIQVINVGFPGTNSTTLVNNFGNLGRSFSPERVLILVGVNDMWTVHEPDRELPSDSLASGRRIL